jgi:CelD/BcsL family acetyltransferase involved in cellulose biosynthesis
VASFLDDPAPLEAAAREARYRVITRVRERSPYVPLAGDLDAYLATLDRKHVKEVRRLRRRLEEQGEVTFAVATDAGPLDEFLRVEAAGWKGEGGTAVASQPGTEAFYREVAAWAERRGTLRLASLRLDGRAVAYELLLEEQGVLYDLKGGYDEGFRRFAPGHLIAYELIADATARGLASFEFLGADEPFKLAWTSNVRERMHVEAFAPSPLGLVGYAAQVWGRPLAKRLLRR